MNDDGLLCMCVCRRGFLAPEPRAEPRSRGVCCGSVERAGWLYTRRVLVYEWTSRGDKQRQEPGHYILVGELTSGLSAVYKYVLRTSNCARHVYGARR